jgi:hypothetical protein
MSKPANKHECLCCHQLHYKQGQPLKAHEFIEQFTLLEAMGYTREELLADHREQLDYQLPGMAQWLEGQ